MTEIASRGGGGNSRRRARPHPTDNAAIYDGRRYLGIVLPHGNTAWRAVILRGRLRDNPRAQGRGWAGMGAKDARKYRAAEK